MERHVRLTLWRLSPPFRRTVEVRRITIGGFLDLVRTLAPKAAAALVNAQGPLTDSGLIRACSDADALAYFADLVVVDKPVGFLRAWLHGHLGGFFARRNTNALLASCRLVEGDGQWTRFLGCLNHSKPDAAAKKKGKGGGLGADVEMLALAGYGSYDDICDWTMQRFLNLCDSVNLRYRSESIADPTMDPDCEASDSIGIPGLFQVH